MSVVLGIDPAWTVGNPSGVAVFKSDSSSWKCCGFAPSYASFFALAEGHCVEWKAVHQGSRPAASGLIEAARALIGEESIDVVTVDMPISNLAFTGRRGPDNLISSVFGAAKCATHSPSKSRPGTMGESFVNDMKSLGYLIGTKSSRCGDAQRIIEVYPHTALLRLLVRDERLEYKSSKTRRYWPDASIVERKEALFLNWRQIIDALDQRIGSIGFPLPDLDEFKDLPFSRLKTFEDALDALVCAWVGVTYLEGECEAYGDENAAIWVPKVEAARRTS